MADDWKTWAGIAAIRADCEAQAAKEGLSGIHLFFRSQKLFSERLEAKPTYREKHAKWRDEQLAKQPAPAPKFTEAELTYIAARFIGANDEVGQSVHLKAMAMIARMK